MLLQFLAYGVLTVGGVVLGRRVDVQHLQLLEQLPRVPNGWQRDGYPDAARRLPFRIALRPHNEAHFHQTLLEVSNPRHENYGRHLSRQQMRDLIRPSSGAAHDVAAWLRRSGVADADIREDNDWVHFETTVAIAESMLDSTFEMFYRSHSSQDNQKDREGMVRALKYSVPRDLYDQIAFISPIVRFPGPQAEPSVEPRSSFSAKFRSRDLAADEGCMSIATPDCLRDLYNITGYTPLANSSEVLAVSGFLEQYARYSDLKAFLAQYAPSIADASFTWTSVNGGKLDQNSTLGSTEANLDIQYAVSLAYPLDVEFYSVAGRGPSIPELGKPASSDATNEPYLEFLDYMLGLENPPHTITNSYSEDEQTLPVAYTDKVCNMFGALGARGVSVVFASGDDGVGKACQTNDGKNTTRFLTKFPASCPYVTSVGGTRNLGPEQAWPLSSGGFSDRFVRPSWQDDAVGKYLDTLGDQWQDLYNRSGRGMPDVSARALRFQYYEKGSHAGQSGTSASAPVFAAIIALLNAARVEGGGKPLGFLNPWLYSTVAPAGALNDITVGGSTGCTARDIIGLDTPYVPYASWNATAGWDPVTGLGTPDFRKMLAVVRGE